MKQLIEIISAVLHGEKLAVRIDEKLLALAEYHTVAPFLYPCMDRESTDKNILNRVTEIYFSALKRDAVQQCERAALEDEFEKSQIPYLPLKGMVMKSLYPQSHLRTMADLDYLVDVSDFDKARRIIADKGYKAQANCEHHVEFEKPPIMVVELHRMLIADDKMGKDLFTDVLSRCKVKQGLSYGLVMSDEDFYLHLMLHLIKHYSSGGTGLRSFIDVYLYLKAKPDLDREYLNNAFAQTDYAQTVALIERFSLDLFDGKPLDEEEMSVLKRVVYSGTYGTMQNLSESELQTAGNSAVKAVLRKMFPAVKTMKVLYPVLAKGAGILLLPVFYVWHIVTRLFNFRHSMSRVRELSRAKKRNLEQSQKDSAVGGEDK